ncbi:signal transduction histidine kinase, partial [Leucobacter sp. OLES1]
HWLTALDGTADAAIERGVPAREVWVAVCEDLDVPPSRRYGRGLRDPQR